MHHVACGKRNTTSESKLSTDMATQERKAVSRKTKTTHTNIGTPPFLTDSQVLAKNVLSASSGTFTRASLKNPLQFPVANYRVRWFSYTLIFPAGPSFHLGVPHFPTGTTSKADESLSAAHLLDRSSPLSASASRSSSSIIWAHSFPLCRRP